MKRLLKLIMLLVLTIGWCNLFAQKYGQAYVDSLLQAVQKQKEDTIKATLLRELSFEYVMINPDEGLKYGQLSLELATKLGWKKGMGDANCNIGNNYARKSFPVAVEYFLKALKIQEERGDKDNAVQVMLNISDYYQGRSAYTTALEYSFKALKIAEETGNKTNIAFAKSVLGNIYANQGNDQKALEYYFSGLKVVEDAGDKGHTASQLICIGEVYIDQKDYPNALIYCFKALQIYEEIDQKFGAVACKRDIGNIYLLQKNYGTSIAYFQESLETAKEIDDKDVMASDLINIGKAYLFSVKDTARVIKVNTDNNEWKASGVSAARKTEQGVQSIPFGKAALLPKAIDYIERGTIIANEVQDPDLTQQGYKLLAEAYELSGNYKRSLEYTHKYSLLTDSVFSKENNEKLVKLEMDNEYGKREDSIKLEHVKNEKIAALKLQRQQVYIYAGSAGILALMIFSFFIFRERGKSEKERRKSELERKKSDNLLLNILPGEVANELKATGTSAARHFNNVTVLFTDFVNFTSAGERMSPQMLVDELHACFKAFDHITGKYNIEKIKTIGDAYLAVCGLPVADPDHAANIIIAAIEINSFMQDRLAKLGDSTFAIRIGIHSGSVVAGIVGAKKFAYDIWGDTVNTAARMEQNSEAGKINISQTTYELVKHKFTCTYRGEIEAKGKGQMKMYFINA